MSKVKTVKICVKTGTKGPDGPMSQKLGSNQVNAKAFLDKFNSATDKIEPNILFNVNITVKDRTNFDIDVKGPVISERIKQLIKLDKGSSRPNLDVASQITKEQIKQICQEKIAFSNCYTLEAMENIVIGTAKSMGVQIQ